jgi:hypothetical protein
VSPVRDTSLLEMRELVATPFGTDKTRGVTLGWFFTDHPTLGRILSHDGEVDGHSAALWLAPRTTLYGCDQPPTVGSDSRTDRTGGVSLAAGLTRGGTSATTLCR